MTCDVTFVMTYAVTFMRFCMCAIFVCAVFTIQYIVPIFIIYDYIYERTFIIYTVSQYITLLYEGDIYIDHVNIKEVDATYIRKNITYVNQSSKLFDRKVIDNILYGCNNIQKVFKTYMETGERPEKYRREYKFQ